MPTLEKVYVLYECVLKNSGRISAFRYGIYCFVEKYHNFVRNDSSDGISYTDNISLDLTISLIFFERSEFLDFQSFIYSFVKPTGVKYNPEHSLELAYEKISKISFDEMNTNRLLSSDYSKPVDDISPPISHMTDLSSTSITKSCRITDEIMLRMIENPGNVDLVMHNVEICHLMSQTTYPKYKNNNNNIIFMGRNLHEHFDGINLEDKIPTFFIQPIDVRLKQRVVMNGQEFCKDCVIVNICFRKNDKVKALVGLLKEGIMTVDAYTYNTELYFDDGGEAVKFLEYKCKISREKIEKYEKTIDMLLEEP